MKTKALFGMLIIGCLALLTACGGGDIANDGTTKHVGEQTAGKAGANPFVTAVADGSGNIVIDTVAISENATYINYDSNGATIQLIAVRASDGDVRVSLNTCQACTPSPRAYFVQDGAYFICQNCMNAFATDQVGLVHGGCNPIPVAEKTVSEGSIAIPASYLDQFSGNFTNWQGLTA